MADRTISPNAVTSIFTMSSPRRSVVGRSSSKVTSSRAATHDATRAGTSNG